MIAQEQPAEYWARLVDASTLTISGRRSSLTGLMSQANSIGARSSHLVRDLGLLAATAVVIGNTIGTGVFLVSSDMARAVGSTELVLVAWVLGGLIVLCGAFCYAELGAAFPRAGGTYVYLEEGLGPLSGFLFGWMSSFLERPVGMATLAAGFLRFAGFVFPAVSKPWFTGHVGAYEFTVTAAQPLAALVVVLVTAVNYFSVRTSGAIQVFLTGLKILTIAGGLGTISALLTALVPAMWAYNGFNDLGNLGEEIKEPGRNLPRAIILGLFTIGTLYLSANLVYFHVLSFDQVQASQHVASDAVRTFAGQSGAVWVTIAMAVSALGALHVVVLTGSRVPYAMARDGLFFEFTKRVHPTFHTPTGSLLFLGIVATLLALTGTYEELYSLFVFAVWIFFGLNAIALIRLRVKNPQLARPYRAWGFPWTCLVFLIAALSITVNLWMVRPVRSTVGLLVILSGIPFFYRFRKLRRG